MKAAESVESAGAAGDVGDGQGGRVAGKDGVSKKSYRNTQLMRNTEVRHVQIQHVSS